MKNRKILTSLFAMLMVCVLILSGCTTPANESSTSEGEKSANSTPTDSASSGGEDSPAVEKIVIFQSKVEIIDQLEACAKAYEAESGVKVEVQGTTGDDYFQQLKIGLSSQQGPTIMNVAPGAEVKELTNYLADLSDLEVAGKIDDNLAIKSEDGRVVGIPYTVEGFGMVYNKDLMSPETVNNYDSFVKMLEEMKAKDINGFGLSQESYFLIGHIMNHPFSIMEDMEGFMEKLGAGEVKMADTPEFQEWAKFMTAIRANSYNPLEVNYDKECGDFATGKTAAIHQGNWCYSMFADYDVDFEMGIMPFPLMGNDKLAVSVPSAWVVNGTAPEAEIQAGKDFLNWLYSSETGIKYLTEEFGFIPVVDGVTSESMDPLSAAVSEYATSGNVVPWATNLYPAGIVDVYLVPVAQEFFTSEMSEADFLVKLDEAWSQATA